MAVIVAGSAYLWSWYTAKDSVLYVVNGLPVDVVVSVGERELTLEAGEKGRLDQLRRGEFEIRAATLDGYAIESLAAEFQGSEAPMLYSVLGACPLILNEIEIKADGTRSYGQAAELAEPGSVGPMPPFDLLFPDDELISGLAAGTYRSLDRRAGGWHAALSAKLANPDIKSREVASLARGIAAIPGIPFEQCLRALDFVAFGESPRDAAIFGCELSFRAPENIEFRRQTFALLQRHASAEDVRKFFRAETAKAEADALSFEFFAKSLGPAAGKDVIDEGLRRFGSDPHLNLLAATRALIQDDDTALEKSLAAIAELPIESWPSEDAAWVAELRLRQGLRNRDVPRAYEEFSEALARLKVEDAAGLLVFWQRISGREDFPQGLPKLRDLVAGQDVVTEKSQSLLTTLTVSASRGDVSEEILKGFPSSALLDALKLRLDLERGIAVASAAVLSASDDILMLLDEDARLAASGFLFEAGQEVRATALVETLNLDVRRGFAAAMSGKDEEFNDCWLKPEPRAILLYFASRRVDARDQAERKRIRDAALAADRLDGFARRFIERGD